MIPEEERGDLIAGLQPAAVLRRPDAETRYARAWAAWENALASIESDGGGGDSPADYARAFARLENHYFLQGAFSRKTARSCATWARIAHIPGHHRAGPLRHDLPAGIGAAPPPGVAPATGRGLERAMPASGAPMPHILPKPGILDIAPYQGGAAALAGRADVLKLSSNENPFGPSPAARDAYRSVADSLERYPPGGHETLRAAIAAAHGLEPDRIVCGAGSDEIIALLCQAYAGPGDVVLHTEHGFSMYRICAQAAGATPREVPERDRRVDVDALVAAARTTPAARLIFVANPGNPTGTMLETAELRRLADGIPDDCLLVLDGAYAEYVEGYDGGAALAAGRANVAMTRTFSKIHGLGGVRAGWAFGPAHVIDVLNRMRGPFNLSAPALAAAEAAMRDRAWEAHCRAENARLRDTLAADLRQAGIAVDPSAANFVLARFADAAEAEAADAALRADGILARRVAGYGFPEGLRITIGDAKACRRVAATLTAFRAARSVA
jgi:histidinol-phosphate aminotransferase